MTRPRGYIEWKPQKKSVLLVEQIQDILVQNADYLPLSLRQIFYLGVSSFAWPKTEKFYNSLSNLLCRARRAGMIAFEDIRDDGVVRNRTTVWASQNEFLQTFELHAESFRLDPMVSQDMNTRLNTVEGVTDYAEYLTKWGAAAHPAIRGKAYRSELKILQGSSVSSVVPSPIHADVATAISHDEIPF